MHYDDLSLESQECVRWWVDLTPTLRDAEDFAANVAKYDTPYFFEVLQEDIDTDDAVTYFAEAVFSETIHLSKAINEFKSTISYKWLELLKGFIEDYEEILEDMEDA